MTWQIKVTVHAPLLIAVTDGAGTVGMLCNLCQSAATCFHSVFTHFDRHNRIRGVEESYRLKCIVVFFVVFLPQSFICIVLFIYPWHYWFVSDTE